MYEAGVSSVALTNPMLGSSTSPMSGAAPTLPDSVLAWSAARARGARTKPYIIANGSLWIQNLEGHTKSYTIKPVTTDSSKRRPYFSADLLKTCPYLWDAPEGTEIYEGFGRCNTHANQRRPCDGKLENCKTIRKDGRSGALTEPSHYAGVITNGGPMQTGAPFPLTTG